MNKFFNNIDTVFYHANCMDGLGSVAIFTQYYSPSEIIAVKHHQQPKTIYKNKNLLFLDFCYPEEIMKPLIDNNQVFIIDHHKTALFMKDLLPLNHQYIYMDKCATMLTWEVLNGNIEPPIIVKYINDRDLWLNKMPDYQVVFDGMTMLNLNVESMQKLIFEDSQIENLKHVGSIVNTNKMNNIEFIKNKMYIRSYIHENKEYTVGYINCPIYSSDIGSFLNTNYEIDFAAVYHFNGERTIFSLRGKDKIDLSSVAKKYGGGGHPNASGCSIVGMVDSLI